MKTLPIRRVTPPLAASLVAGLVFREMLRKTKPATATEAGRTHVDRFEHLTMGTSARRSRGSTPAAEFRAGMLAVSGAWDELNEGVAAVQLTCPADSWSKGIV